MKGKKKGRKETLRAVVLAYVSAQDTVPHNVSFFRKYVRVVLNQFVWEIIRVQNHAQLSKKTKATT